MKYSHILTILGIFLLQGFLQITPAQALELGIRPQNVYGLWLNIDKISQHLEVELLKKYHANRLTILPRVHKDKKPADVFALVKEVEKKYQLVYGTHPVQQVPDWASTLFRLNKDSTTKPSHVYLYSSQLLNELIHLYIANSKDNSPISPYFHEWDLSAKTPNDVYAYIETISARYDHYIQLMGTTQ